jgi:hypothetical protein
VNCSLFGCARQRNACLDLGAGETLALCWEHERAWVASLSRACALDHLAAWRRAVEGEAVGTGRDSNTTAETGGST